MKKWLELLLLTGLLCLAGGCGSQSGEEESGYRIWYVNQKETRLEYEYKELQAKNTEGLLKEALEVLRESPWDDGYKPVLPENVRIESYTI